MHKTTWLCIKNYVTGKNYITMHGKQFGAEQQQQV